MPLLLVLACATFVGSFSIRMIDPLVPEIAASVATSEANVSLLASAFAIPYALIQPLLGPVADRIGKALVIKFCLFGLMLATALTAVATTIEAMLIARVAGGLAGGSIIPLAIALVGDRVALDRRQLALSQILTASISAILAATVGTGLLAQWIGWRGVFWVATAASGFALVMAMASFRSRPRAERDAQATAKLGLMASYRRIFENPRSIICYTAVFCEGLLVFGLLPYVASLLAARGAGGVFEAGLVLAGFAVGGLLYAQIASRFIARIGGVPNLIRMGAMFVVIGYLGVAQQGDWVSEMLAFLAFGFGFYSIHNSLQMQATELAPANRGSAVALFAFCFFLGQAAGPVFYAFAFSVAAPPVVIAAVGATAFVLALTLAHHFRRPPSGAA